MQSKITVVKDKDTVNQLLSNQKYRYYYKGSVEIIVPNSHKASHRALGKIYSTSEELLACITTLIPKVINLKIDINKKFNLPNLNNYFLEIENVSEPYIFFNMPNSFTLKAYMNVGGIILAFTIPQGDSGIFNSKPFKEFVLQIYNMEEKIHNFI